MGLEKAAQWKTIIKTNPDIFGNATIDDIPNGEIPEIIIEDMSGFIRKVSYKRDDFDGVLKGIFNRIQMHQKTEKYIIVCDERSFVPICKHVEQTKRDNAKKGEESDPFAADFTNDEINLIDFKCLSKRPERFKKMPSIDYVQKVVDSRKVSFKLNGFLGAEMLKFEFPFSNECNLVIDGTPLNYLSENYDFYNSRVNLWTTKENMSSFKFRKVDELSNYQKTKEVSYKSEVTRIDKCVFTTGIMNVHAQKDVPKNNVSIFGSNKVGEGEMKIVRHLMDLDKNEPKTILIISEDTDLIPILLLSMKHLINDQTENINFKIYLDMTYSNKRANCASKNIPFTHDIVDIVEMWRSIYDYFSKHHQVVICPIETIVLLMALCGSDYNTEVLPDFSPKSVWKYFIQEGHLLFARKKDLYPLDTHGSMEGALSSSSSDSSSSSSENGKSPLRTDPDDPENAYAITPEGIFGNPKERTEIDILEFKVYRFVMNYYYYKNKPSEKRPVNQGNLNELRSYMSHVKKSSKKKLPEDLKISAFIRRCTWVIDYWTNGGLPVEKKYKDPLEKVKVKAWNDPNQIIEVSKWGWAIEDSKVVETSKIVV